ncbi:conserved hypothetical protein [Rubrivivax sp. A210]|uniref:hypothetical protein n=1 Tax=Rubrivivax sp. A210 TaxID=2772301 RepID=UPI00191B5AA7|nr:hypothetical protein [Rubrivivax sp. A210]CAD5369300.1 conserved hypothetical protein [Rubrivivax sp. A210]
MERLLVLRLESLGVAAEAVLNGVPLARTSPQRRVVTVPVHEYTLAGANDLELVIEPPAPGEAGAPEPRISDGHCGASVQLLLPRIGQIAHPDNARTLARIDWAPPADEVTVLPHSLRQVADLKIGFPRWRWLDAPVLPPTPELLGAAAAYLQGLVLGLQRGDPEPLLLASRLRLEELAQAYQRSLADDVGRLRLQVQQWHAKQPLKPPMPKADTLRLRPLAGGRLLECLGADGGAALHSAVAGGGRVEWPLRLAQIEGRFYVLR